MMGRCASKGNASLWTWRAVHTASPVAPHLLFAGVDIPPINPFAMVRTEPQVFKTSRKRAIFLPQHLRNSDAEFPGMCVAQASPVPAKLRIL